MKLRNKRTGEIATLTLSTNGEDMIIMGNDMLAHITKLSELKDYEDYEEPKEYWYVSAYGNLAKTDVMTSLHRGAEEIGNHFETREEAEKAVEKLKAWKRIKDKGAEFYGWRRNQTGTYEFYIRWEDRIPRSYEVKNDLDTLFGGEE